MSPHCRRCPRSAWHARDFTGAVVPASRIVAAKDQKAQIEAFLRAAVEIAIKMLS